jgi:hypothetical protein
MAADAQMMSHFYNPLHHMYGSLHSSRYPVGPGSADKYAGAGNSGEYIGDTSRYMPGTGGSLENGGDRSPSTPLQQSYDDRQYLTPPASGGNEMLEVKPLPHLMKEDKIVKDEIGQHGGIDNTGGNGSDKTNSQYPAPADSSTDYSGQYYAAVNPHIGGNDPIAAAHTDLSHPGHPAYGGYYTTGSSVVGGGGSGGSSHRHTGGGSNKNKTQTGDHEFN